MRCFESPAWNAVWFFLFRFFQQFPELDYFVDEMQDFCPFYAQFHMEDVQDRFVDLASGQTKEMKAQIDPEL